MSSEKLNCAIVSDLLPLYHDGVVSEITADAVKTHLADCENCAGEYNALCAELPTGKSAVSTKSKFSGMMKKLKRKRLFVTIIIAILSCALLAGTIAVLTQVPLVDVSDENIQIERVYRYETDGENKFFILFSMPVFTKITYGNISVSGEPGDEYTLEVNRRTSVLSSVVEDMPREDRIWIIREADLNDRETDLNDIEVLKFGDQIIWTENENADDPIPAYVYAYDEFANGNSIDGWTCSLEEGYLGADYVDGRYVIWNLDGDVLYDSHPDANGEYMDVPYDSYPDPNGKYTDISF